MTEPAARSREVRLKSYPEGAITADHFETVTVDVPHPAEREVLVRNLWMSIDAGQRTLMSPGESKVADLPPRRFELGEPLDAQAVGQVVESHDDSLPVGTFVVSNRGWREYFTFSGVPDGFTFSVLKNPVKPLQAHLHVLSLYGASAYFHITDAGRARPGDTVWISTAAGTVGSIACQIARLSGCRVVGTTSSDEKVQWLLDELKLDAAFNYRTSDLRREVRSACPDGVDVYLDSAGGVQLESAIDVMNPHGRIVKIGDTSAYDGGVPVGPRNMFQLVLQRVDILNRSIFDYLTPPDRLATAYSRLGKWYSEGRISVHETVYEGISAAPAAQIDLLAGRNIGKTLVKLGDEL